MIKSLDPTYSILLRKKSFLVTGNPIKKPLADQQEWFMLI